MTTQDRLARALATRYRLDRELGAGGMATVYLAHDLKHEREVAIKVLHPDLGAALGAERFLAEIKMTAKLQHPHILPLLDSGAADGLLYYVMPYVAGETLRARLERDRQLPIPDAVRIAREVASALEHAHKQGIIHRDIKPENILLQDGAALVADFGIALAVQTAGGARMTQTGLSLGTPSYMSPEQAMGERTIDARSDIYALGAVTYEMLAGEPPFSGASVQAIVAKVLAERPVSLATLRDTVHPSLDAAVTKALSKTPADRFSSAALFISALSAPPEANSTADGGSPQRRFAIRSMIALALLASGWFVFSTGRSSARVESIEQNVLSRPVVRFDLQAIAGYDYTYVHIGELLRDGSGVAYVGDGPAGHGVYIRSFADSMPRLLSFPGATIEARPTQDGTGVLTYAIDAQVKLYNVPFNGAPPRLVTKDLMFASSSDAEGNIYATSFATRGIGRVDENGTFKSITKPDTARGEAEHRQPFVLAGNAGLLFYITYRDNRSPVIATSDLDGRDIKVVAEGFAPAALPNGYIIFVTSDSTLSAMRFDAAARKAVGQSVPVVTDASLTELLRLFSISAAGDLYYVTESKRRWEILRGDSAATERMLEGVGGAPLAFHPIQDAGRFLLLEANGLVVRGQNGFTRTFGAMRASTLGNLDGKRNTVLVGQSDTDARNARLRSWVEVPVTGDLEPTSISLGPGADTSTYLMPTKSGQRLVYAGPPRRVAGSNQLERPIILRSLGGGAPIEITTARNLVDLALSPDGRFLAYSAGSPNRIYVTAVPPSSGTWEIAMGTMPRWAPNSRQLFFTTPTNRFLNRPEPVLGVTLTERPDFRFSGVDTVARPPVGATPVWAVGPRDGAIYWVAQRSQMRYRVVLNFAREVDSLMRLAEKW